MSPSFRILFIKVLAFLLLIGPGLMMITGPQSPFFPAINLFLDFAYQPYNGAEQISDGAGYLLNAILGGVLAGFGAMIWMVADDVLASNERLGRKLIVFPLLIWFSGDSLGSILAGAWFNAVINMLIFGLFLIPLFVKTKQPNSTDGTV